MPKQSPKQYTPDDKAVKATCAPPKATQELAASDKLIYEKNFEGNFHPNLDDSNPRPPAFRQKYGGFSKKNERELYPKKLLTSTPVESRRNEKEPEKGR